MLPQSCEASCGLADAAYKVYSLRRSGRAQFGAGQGELEVGVRGIMIQ